MATAPPLVRIARRWRGAPGPWDALASLAAHPHPFLRWARAGPRDLPRWSYASAAPGEVLRIEGTRRGLQADPWEALRARWPRRVAPRGPAPFGGGWFGLWSYEARAAVERTPPPRVPADGFPGVWLGRYGAVLAWDGATGRAWLVATAPTKAAAADASDRLREALRARAPRRERPPAPTAGRMRACGTPAAYRAKVADVVARIRRGDLFQANLSQRFEGRLAGSPLDLFARIADRSPAPFLTFLGVGGGRFVLSASPERFLSLEGRRAQTRPMKGTRRRGADAAADRAVRRELEASVKDRAELAMIVDLARNDLARSCAPGSVRVARARRLEPYSTVHQAVGVVEGRLRPGATGVDLLRGAFPPGSVTGAPKVEALRVIDALEGEARGPYCGAIGWLDEGGDLDLAVAIRTVCVAGRRVAYRVGGGITLLSDPEAERRETLDKGAALAAAIAGAST